MLIAAGIGIILVLTFFTGYFVAQEFAYVTVDRGRLRQLAREGDAKAERALDITSRLSFTLSGAQFGITVTTLLVGLAAEPLVSRGLTEWLGWTGLPTGVTTSISLVGTALFSTAVQMVFGELGPKNWAISEPVRLARALSRSTVIYLAVFGWIIRFFDAASNALLRAVGVEPVQELPHGATSEDLSRIIADSRTDGLLDDDLSTMLGRGLAFRGYVAEEVMTPRIDVETVQADEPASRVLELLATGHARFPVYGRDIDDIVGVIGLHELLDVPSEDRGTTPVRDLVGDPVIIPESLPLPKVLEALRENRRQLACVVDEHGGFAGIVSFEDIAEEVVGEIWDEDDEDVPEPTVREDGSWELAARLRLDEVATLTGVDLPEDEDYDTVSGLVMDRLERIAEPGDSVTVTWQDRDDEGLPEVHEVRIDVLTTARHVPEQVAVHPPSIRAGSLDDGEADGAGPGEAPDDAPVPGDEPREEASR